ncbi:MAG: glycerol-3-phosphate dehydrogenase/oxidase [Actinobacteria bacterium]|nr:glycerol-3-phosphate dehydrogenase/oxidase [Actinomycetota bacterium]
MIPFDAEARRRNLERMAESELDVLVVGGGITGAGVALDAASRGFSVGLVEREDFASGTSGRSSRLVHGGVRYLQRAELGLVHESLRERAVLLRLAPHLVRPVRLFLPARRRSLRTAFRAGLLTYDLLAWGRNIGRHRAVDEREVAAAVPGLARPAPGLQYWECATDDARLTLEVARAAAGHGALVANHALVVGLTGGERVTGARVRDTLSGESFEVRARVTVNATGVWADRVQGMAAGDPRHLSPSKGVHLVFGPGAVGTRAAVFIPSGAGDRRYVFVVPWGDRVYAGTTDTPHEGDLNDPRVDPAGRAYVLHAVTRAFPSVTEADVVGEWAGLRPLLSGKGGATADLSRKHAIYAEPPGLLTITGGKLTTYRAMAQELVDRVERLLGRRGPCLSTGIRLGFTGSIRPTLGRAALKSERTGLPPDDGRRRVERFGDDSEGALRMIREEPDLAGPVAEGATVLEVERRLARDREMALTEDDVTDRRTRLGTFGVGGGVRS